VSGTDAAPIIVAGHLTVDAEDRDVYLRSCESVVRAARDADGYLDFALGADLVDPTRVNVYGYRRDRLALEAFRGQGPDDDRRATPITIEVGDDQVQPSGGRT
jgi:heme-degrading monooxygenase HmoA